MRQRGFRLSLLGRFSLLSLLALTVLGVVVGLVLTSRIEHRARTNATRLAVVMARTGAASALTPADLRGPVSPRRASVLDRTLKRPLIGNGAAIVKVYNDKGTVVYAGNHEQIGEREPDEVTRPLAGSVVNEMARGTHDNGKGARMLSVYLPLSVAGGARPDGVFELYLPYAPVAAAIAHDTRILTLILIAGLLLVWLGLFRIVASASRRLRRQARQDHLTKLPNRAQLHADGARALRSATRSDRLVALLLIDLDRFKEINDTLGHEQGDMLLIEVAARLRDALRPSDVLARLGGDEFAVLITELPDRGAAVELSGRLRDALARPFALCGVAIELGASIGIAFRGDHGNDLGTLLRRADVAMYEAKHGGSGIATYERSRDPYSPDRLALASELRRGIADGELVLHYQPKVAVDGGRVTGVEALVRWQHPTRGLLAPADFVPLAERTGMIGAVTHWVIETALAQSRVWADAGLDLPVAVNLSGADVLDAGLADTIAAALDHAGVAGNRLECELSEDTVLADPGRAIESLTRLRAMGVRLSLDDFGQGQSSLSYLKRLPLDELKIDRSFVMGMATDDSDAAIVRATIDLGRHLGLSVVAEGVETDEVLSSLADLRCDVAQGFGLSRPLPIEDLTRWLDERAAARVA